MRLIKTVYILDTNIYIENGNVLQEFEDRHVIIPFVVLEELDKLKTQPNIGKSIRDAIRHLDTLMQIGNLQHGVETENGSVQVVSTDRCPTYGLDSESNDNKILISALDFVSRGHEAIVISNDVNMRIKCNAYNIHSEAYCSMKIGDKIFTGQAQRSVGDLDIDALYRNEDVLLLPDEEELSPNQYLLLQSFSQPKKTALARFSGYDHPLEIVKEDSRLSKFDAKPRNKEQLFATDLLFNDEIDLVTLVGKAGTGKTYLSTLAALIQVGFDYKKRTYSDRFDKVIITTPVHPLGKDIGYLPGDIQAKLGPWLAPIQDNLKSITGDGMRTLEDYIEQGWIEIQPLSYMRGRSIENCFIIVDEAQNTSKHEIKTILTRAGNNTKIVLTGDIEQIDNPNVDKYSNGLIYVINKFKEHHIAGHIMFSKGERSELATLASQIL